MTDPEKRNISGLVVRQKGDPQTPMMAFSSALSWMVYQLRGTEGNIRSAYYRLQREECSERLSRERQKEFEEIMWQLDTLHATLGELHKKVAEFNKAKKLDTL